MSEDQQLPGGKVKSDKDLAIDSFADDILKIYPNLDREELREQISACVQEYVPDEGAEEEGEEEQGAGTIGKAKGLIKQAAGAVMRNEEMKAEGRLEREGETVEGNKAYFRSVIEETNRRAADRA